LLSEAEVLHRLIHCRNTGLQVPLGLIADLRNEDVLVEVPAKREHGAFSVRQLGARNHGVIEHCLQIAADGGCALVPKHGYENDDERRSAETTHELVTDLEVVEGLHGFPP